MPDVIRSKTASDTPTSAVKVVTTSIERVVSPKASSVGTSGTGKPSHIPQVAFQIYEDETTGNFYTWCGDHWDPRI